MKNSVVERLFETAHHPHFWDKLKIDYLNGGTISPMKVQIGPLEARGFSYGQHSSRYERVENAINIHN